MFTIYQKICSERQRLEQQLISIEKALQKLPEGKLICSRNGNYTKWYQSNGQTPTYIPRKNRQLARQLAEKKYLSLKKKELLQEKKAIDFYLRHHSSDCLSQELLSDSSGFSELLRESFLPSEPSLQEWASAPYERNPKYPDQLAHKTSSGIYVRSKSESIIALFLHIHQIPFRYECALSLNNIVIYPDFTILHPQTGQIFYWEHFGMMDNRTYCQNSISKLQEYAANKIYPGVNLLTTYETKNQPLDSGLVENMIAYYFL